VLVVAIARFVTTARQIDDDEQHEGPGARFDIALTALLFLVGAALFGYLVFNLVAP
jgi:hypothetical protein